MLPRHAVTSKATPAPSSALAHTQTDLPLCTREYRPSTHTQTHTQTDTHTPRCKHTHRYIDTHTQVHRHTDTHRDTHTHIHTGGVFPFP